MRRLPQGGCAVNLRNDPEYDLLLTHELAELLPSIRSTVGVVAIDTCRRLRCIAQESPTRPAQHRLRRGVPTLTPWVAEVPIFDILA